MAKFVDEVMNREMVSVRPGERPEVVLDAILGFGVTAVPVLDATQRPVGVVSLRDLVDRAAATYAVSTPPFTIPAGTSLADAARRLAAGGHHHVVVVDEHGRAVGMLSAIDVLRGLVGAPASHPASFPGYDPDLGVYWTQDAQLDGDHVAAAPETPGVFVLVAGAPGLRDGIVWAEASANVRARLDEMVCAPAAEPPYLARLLATGSLRFRAAAIATESERIATLRALRARYEHLPLPQPSAILEVR